MALEFTDYRGRVILVQEDNGMLSCINETDSSKSTQR